MEDVALAFIAYHKSLLLLHAAGWPGVVLPIRGDEWGGGT